MQRSKRAVYMIDQSDAWCFDIESAARDYQNDHKHRTWTDVQKECAPENVLYCLSRLVLFVCKYAVVVIGHFSMPRVTFVNFVLSLFGLISEDCRYSFPTINIFYQSTCHYLLFLFIGVVAAFQVLYPGTNTKVLEAS